MLSQLVMQPFVMEWAHAVGLLILLLISWRTFRPLRNWLAVRRETQLIVQLAGLIIEKCQLLDKLSQLQKEHEA